MRCSKNIGSNMLSFFGRISSFIMSKSTYLNYSNSKGLGPKGLISTPLNAVFINKGMLQQDRLIELNKIAIQQMKVLEGVEERRMIK